MPVQSVASSGMGYAAPSKQGKQPDMRDYIDFHDQHNRVWGAAVEKETLHSTGPLSPKFRAPFYPEQKYVRELPGRGNIGRVRVNYEQWLEDLGDADRRYRQMLNNYAVGMFGANATEVLKKGIPQELADAVGNPPFPDIFVKAMMAGNKWVLGIPMPSGEAYPVPAWAKPHMPKQEERRAAPQYEEFPDEEPVQDEGESYPKHLGFGKWKLSDGSVIKATSEAAHAAENEIAPALGV